LRARAIYFLAVLSTIEKSRPSEPSGAGALARQWGFFAALTEALLLTT
jgi:hypothetical protein